jgi:SPP1 gp7 family putative phage head morphogenesis protein
VPSIDGYAALAADDAWWAEQGEAVKDAMRPLFLELYLTGAAIAVEADPSTTKALDVDIDTDEFGEAAASAIEDFMDEWWREISDTQRTTLREAIQIARADGLGADFVESELEGAFKKGTNLTRIAVTETTRLVGQGAQASYRKAGFPSWIWRTVNDTAVDPICADLQRQSEAEPFPASQAFIPPHPYCRCWPIPAGTVPASLEAA